MLISASGRALAASAEKAGYAFDVFDYFADADLLQICRLSPEYQNRAFRISAPDELLAITDFSRYEGAIIGGGFENQIHLVRYLESKLKLFGTPAAELERLNSVSSLSDISDCCDEANARFPITVLAPPPADTGKIWLRKDMSGSGGRHVRVLDSHRDLDSNSVRFKPSTIFQEKVSGDSVSALFVGRPSESDTPLTRGPTGSARPVCQFIGCTEQLVGDPRLGAAPFSYCGSVGPIELPLAQKRIIERLGNRLTEKFGLRGFFGIDLIISPESVWLVDINPRITASAELFEGGLDWGNTEHPSIVSIQVASCLGQSVPATPNDGKYRAKGILFCKSADGITIDQGVFNPLMEQYASSSERAQCSIADIPNLNTHIAFGEPVLTVFSQANSPAKAKLRMLDLANEVLQNSQRATPRGEQFD